VEVYEHKYGYNPRTDSMTSYVRRRMHLVQGGNPQLWLIHYLRAPEEGKSTLVLKLSNRSTPSESGSRSTLHSSTVSPPHPCRHQIHVIPSGASCLVQKSKYALACKYGPCSSTLCSPTTLLESSATSATSSISAATTDACTS